MEKYLNIPYYTPPKMQTAVLSIFTGKQALSSLEGLLSKQSVSI